jgi:predicted Zn-dependent peptidase
MNLNRKISPGFNTIEKLTFPQYDCLINSNNQKIYSLCAGIEPVVRIELVFDAGVMKQKVTGESSYTASMLSEGTKSKSALALADALDYYGSYFQVKSNAEDLIATLYCLEKHVDNCLGYFMEAIISSIFPEKELEIIKKNAVQKLLVSNKKNSYLCRKNFYRNVLGPNHPLSAFPSKEDIQNINKETLVSFYEKNIIGGFKYAIVSGNFSDNSLKSISLAIEKSGLHNSNIEQEKQQINSTIGQHFITKNESVQSSIRIGNISISRESEDFRKLQFLNLIFGGYFGSRLMKNIREDKGLTYGIYSVLEPYKNFGIWYIDCELNYKNRERGINEIWIELNRIKNEEISNEEIQSAKNYYLGSFLKSLDGPFSLADRLKIMVDYQLPDSYYPEFVTILNNTTSKDLIEIANKYFTENNMVKIIVGKK